MKKLREDKKEEIPEINNPSIIRSTDIGDKVISEVLKGGYNVQPVPPPNSHIDDRSSRK